MPCGVEDSSRCRGGGGSHGPQADLRPDGGRSDDDIERNRRGRLFCRSSPVLYTPEIDPTRRGVPLRARFRTREARE